ncbi:MAG TPA: wax ester/triacylglycerol synthase domain-containing protein, partial [Solirubrobacterales bacterium]|nr:wax ester/triacylglycerol synthase domain-containing protein [Solirubrobacterales bacterium]
MAEELNALDATFLELEEADQAAHMHIGGVMVFEPPPGGRPPSLTELRRHLEERLGELPRYQQRLSTPSTGGLHWPSWMDDPHFDLAGHLRREALPAPAGEEQL